MTPDQARDARALLGWSKLQVALRSGTSRHFVTVFEATGRAAPVLGWTKKVDALAVVRATLEAAGVEFTDDVVPGVRMRKASE